MALVLSSAMTTVRAAGRFVGRFALDALLPPRCLGCGETVDASGALCPTCFSGFTFIAAPMCHVCGVPLELAVDDDLVCGGCLKERPDFNRARAVFIYDEASKPIVLRFKHGDRTDAAVHLARWMQRVGSTLLESCDVIVPVPLHQWRFLWRTYNQAALLANALGRFSGKPSLPDGLLRVRRTPSQGGLGRAQRRRNVSGAFRVRRPDRIRGKNVLLVDDVFTTGATAEACTRALLAAGAAMVDVLVLGKVPMPR
jgi:ComF family protein